MQLVDLHLTKVAAMSIWAAVLSQSKAIRKKTAPMTYLSKQIL
jgi:hypothetical protein